MSELKVINAYCLTTNTEDSDVYIHNDEFGCGGDLVECYLKDEADKVIAKLENENERLKKQSSCTFSDDCLRVRQLRADYKEACDRLQTANLIKSEADKAIAELEEKHKTEVKELLCLIRDKENNFNRAFDSEEKEIRHHKYKRCLAMARWCEMSARENDTRMCLPEKQKFTKHEEYLYFIGYYHKWHRRWLELAEKFKEKK